MDPQLLINFLNEFDELRISRLHIANEFLSKSQNDEELLADIANILALLYAAKKVMQMPRGFKSDSGG